ncbi:MAG: Maf family protein [Clostridia bacterium]|nr:Maf family protein [Clostridia bacterium]
MIVLASASPRRAELMSLLTDKFIIVPADVDEATSSSHPADIVMDIAILKAKSVARSYPCDTVIGADTIVYYNARALGKPKSEQEAIAYLTELRGKVHCVYTGVCVIKGGRQYCCYERSEVVIRELSDSEILSYVKGGSPMDKAGAYGIQDGVVQSYKGSYENIVGLPTFLISGVPAIAEEI